MKSIFYFLCIGFIGFTSIIAQEKMEVNGFENKKELKNFQATNNSIIKITSENYKYGKQALEWSWTNPASLSNQNIEFVSKKDSPLAYGDHFPASPTFTFSIYHPKASTGTLELAFYNEKGGKVWFPLDLNFYGWRHYWVPFYEMNGEAPKKGAPVDFTRFEISTNNKNDRIFLDDVIYGHFQDDRHQYPDLGVPFIKSDMPYGKDHWMPMIVDWKKIENLKTKPASIAVRKDLLKFQNKIDDNVAMNRKYKVYMNALKEEFASLGLNQKGDVILGPPLTFKQKEIYHNKNIQGKLIFNDISKLGALMKKMANYYEIGNNEQRKEIAKMFLMGTMYYLDQGWQSGASGGTRHHIGYNFREITTAFYKMRHLLREVGLADEVANSLHWLFNLGMVLGDESKFHVNIDYLNTQAYYHLMIIFMSSSAEKQAALLKAYSNYISITLAQEKEQWGFKPDGTSWHHNGHYPAYGMGAFRNVPQIIETLSKTRFRIKTAGHQNFKRAFLTTTLYSHTYDYGFGNAGRHPLEDSDIRSLQKACLSLAKAGDPTGKQKYDNEVAGAYLRLWGKKDQLNSTLFQSIERIPHQKLPKYFIMPYAATAVHRNDNWAAIIKGYSKYVWASEIYVSENRYGRYPANGSVQLLNEKGEKGSQKKPLQEQ